MVRLLLFLLAVAGFAAGAVWLSDQPGSFTLDWQGYEISLSILVAVTVAIICFTLVYFAVRLVKMLFSAPAAAVGAVRRRRQKKGFEALSRGLIAVSAGHGRLAEKLGAKASKLLPDEPLTLLLQAQSAQLKGDSGGAAQVYRTMLERGETRVLGLHGLFLEARRGNDDGVAKVIAERAVALEPDSPWAAPALMDLQSAEGDWLAARQTLAMQKRHKLISKERFKRTQAVLLCAEALDEEENNPEKALDLALEAHKLANDLVPAAVVAARLLAQKGRIAKAAKILEKTWKNLPHPDIAEVYAHLRLGDKPAARLKRIRSLIHKNPEHPESGIALARAAVSAREWAAARSALEPFLESPSQRICALMAQIEDGEFGDKGKVREWLARALRARRDPVWVADGVVAHEWAAVSPVTGALDAFEWKAPLDALPQMEAEGFELHVAGDDGQEAVESPEIADAGKATEKSPPVIEAVVEEAEIIEPEAVVPPVPVKAEGKARTAPPQPDDPGTETAKPEQNRRASLLQ